MKGNYFLTLIIIALALLKPTTASAEEVNIGGLWYEVVSKIKEAKVIQYKNANFYSGEIKIPSSIEYEGVIYNVTSIGDWTFNLCRNVTSITIPNSVKSIGLSAFSGCSGLKKVIIPDIAAWCNITFVDGNGNPLHYAHRIYSDENTEITDLVIPEGVSTINKSAFYDCNKLTSVTIGGGVTSIGSCAFASCSNLKKVIITDIASWCNILFEDSHSNPLSYAHHLYCNENTEISDFTIPNDVSSIGNYSFSDCYGLKSVTIGNSVTSIGNSAFSNCTALTTLTLGNSVASIGNSAFSNCSCITDVIIPNSVISIGNYAFEKCSSLTSIILPNSVTYIGNDAFNACKALVSVTIPESLNSISANTFYDCISLNSITISNSVTSIGNEAFSGCSGLTSVTISNSVTSIGDRAFQNCSGLTSITISNNLTSIGNYVFLGCSGLTSITIPDGVTSIGISAFHDCTNLTSIIIPNSVTSIGSGAFWGCISMTSIIIGNGVTNIGNSAFARCCNITSLVIPNSVTVIGDYAFQGCSGLISVTIGSSVTSIGKYTFSGCIAMTSLSIPNSVTKIGMYAFEKCSALTSLTIPNSVTIIDAYAFQYCSNIKSLTIGSNIKGILSYAFAHCNELMDVYCYAENIPSTQSNIFEGSYIEYATLHVPAASIASYKITEPWSGFGTIVAIDGDEPEPPVLKKCATPTISYSNGELSFNCDTEGAEFVSEITDSDIKKNYTAKIKLSITYNLTVYATKTDYENSDTIHATLCWIDMMPQTDGIVNEDAVTELKAMPVLIQSRDGAICVSGVPDDTTINIFDMSGRQLGASSIVNGSAKVKILSTEKIIIVKIGDKAVKVKRTI